VPERAASLAGFLGESPSLRQTFIYADAQKGPLDPAPFGQMERVEEQDKDVIAATKNLHLTMMLASFLISGAGIYLAYLLHLKYREKSVEIAARYPAIIRVLEGKYFVDEIYQRMIVEPLRALGRACVAFDNFIIDGILWLISFAPQASGFVLKVSTQRGYLQGYSVTMILGVVVILLYVFL
jgi:NADH-quinone oxidoreductase subunit L